MEERLLADGKYRPIGIQPKPQAIVSRRAFIGAGVAAPISIALVSRAVADDGKGNEDLQFLKDDDGIIVRYRARDAQKSPDGSLRFVDRQWRLTRTAFGSAVKFTLRTLRAGKSKGYEVRIENARFGPVNRHHLLVIHRVKDEWKVRIRTTLWTTDPDTELTSNDLTLDELSVPVSPRENSNDNKGATNCRFHFDVNSARLHRTFDAIFEGFLQLVGQIRLTLDPDFVWNVTPIGKGSRIVVAPYQLTVPALELAWCELTSGKKTNPDRKIPKELKPTGEPNSDKSNERGEPVFCAAGNIAERQWSVRFVGGSAVRGTIASAEKENLGFNYVRRDWMWKGSSSVPHPSGVATIRGNWTLTTELERKQSISDLTIEKGAFELRYQGLRSPRKLNASFTGALDEQQKPLQTLIGSLIARGWKAESATADVERPQISLIFDYSRGAPVGSAPSQALSIDVPLLLLESNLAPAESQFSRFKFGPTLVVALWRKNRKEILDATDPSVGSYIWLGLPKQLAERPIARVDLSHARLEAARTKDLLSLAFMFSGLNLEIYSNLVRIRPAAESCRVIRRESRTGPQSSNESLIIDSRPTLVVEFPPQHIYEQAIFRPSSTEFPDIELKETTIQVPASALSEKARAQLGVAENDVVEIKTEPLGFLTKLKKLDQAGDRRVVREAYSKAKVDSTSGTQQEQKDFKRLVAELKEQQRSFVGTEAPSEDQFIYIGPYEMDPDVRAVARALVANRHREQVAALFESVLRNANALIKNYGSTQDSSGFDAFLRKLKELFIKTQYSEDSSEYALLKEIAAGSVIAEFEFFRDFYRETMIELLLRAESPTNRSLVLDEGYAPKSAAPSETEYYSESNRTWKDAPKTALEKRETFVRKRYIQALQGMERIPEFARARLAKPSRLAFRINCGPKSLVELGKRPRAEQIDDSLAFCVDALTDWSRHELAVMPRAQAVVGFNEAGLPIVDMVREADQAREESKDAIKKKSEIEADASSGDDVSMLRMLGMRSGRYVTAQERLADVEASLHKAPTSLETAIEIPARLVLSPSQLAVWRTPHEFPGMPVSRTSAKDSEGPFPVWSATLALDGVNPNVRAVHSPDLRPGFVRKGLEQAARRGLLSEENDALRTPFLGAPPRGPRAPWTLGIEEGDSSGDPLDKVIEALGTTRSAAEKSYEEACSISSDQNDEPKTDKNARERGTPERIHPLVEYMFSRERAMKSYGEHGMFRSSLDAYDRHELVLLTSAWGLPVRGRREQNGQLLAVSTSSQIEPPKPYQPIDLEMASALYRPRPLKVQELRLTALGGTFRHDTDFVPPSAARHVSYGPLFNSLTIERWQHWAVLGRDVFAEVVYKGFLFPIGHRASLIKQTERVFLRAQNSGGEPVGTVRAFLRQRMFIRIGQPDKTFPALGQPNLSRQFPVGIFRMLTTTTPDIVDPAQDTKEIYIDDSEKKRIQVPTPAGRLFAEHGPALVFWPRTARLAGAEVRFDTLIESSFVNLPLIFVDNIAVNDPVLLAKLVKHYGEEIKGPDSNGEGINAFDPLTHLRTIDFGGQAHRYCDEFKPGSATHKTLYWTLSASGGAKYAAKVDHAPADSSDPNSSVNWAGDNTRFDDPTLEAADQPPFYPVLESARIRLDQLERITANRAAPAVVKFDGYFVANGFPSVDPIDSEAIQQSENSAGSPQSSSDRADPNNPLEIYLNVVNHLTFDMGSAGDRSGGMFRPESKVVAISRGRGPVGGQTSAPYGPKLISLAANYNDQGPEGADRQDIRVEKYGNYFPKPSGKMPDTKLLGIVSLSDLLKYIKLVPIGQGAPELREVINYGDASVADLIRSHVIPGLQKAVITIDTQWKYLATQLRESRSDSSSKPPTMKELFPEVAFTLADMHHALTNSAETVDSGEFYTTLGEVYESGRRLVDALGRASANPIERVYVAIARRIPADLLDFNRLVNMPIRDLRSAIGLESANLDNVAAMIAESVIKDANGRARFLPIPLKVGNQLKESVLSDIRLSLATSLAEVLKSGSATAELDKFVGDTRRKTESIVDWNRDSGVAAASVRRSIEPLFGALASLSRALGNSQDTVGALADASLELLRVLGPRPFNASIEQKDLGKLFKALTENLEERGKTVAAGDPKRPPIKLWIPPAESIYFPDELKESEAAPHWYSRSNLARAVYEFATSIDSAVREDSLKHQSQLRARLIGIGNRALLSLPALLELSRKSSALLKAFRRETKEAGEGLTYIHVDILKSVMEADADLLDWTELALDIVLPIDLPDFETIGPKLDNELGKQVRSVLKHVFRIRSLALEWIENSWGDFEKTLGISSGGVSAEAQTIFAETKLAAILVDKEGTWRQWMNVPIPRYRKMLDTTAASKVRLPLATISISILGKLEGWWSSLLALGSKHSELASRTADSVIKSITPIYEEILKKRNSAYEELTDALDAKAVAAMLLVNVDQARLFNSSEEPPKILEPSNDQLQGEYQSLKDVRAGIADDKLLDDAKRLSYVVEFLRGWRDGDAAPLRVLKQLNRINQEDARARLLTLIDFSGMREEIDQHIRRLVPTSASLSYSFSAEFNDVENGSAVFQPRAGSRLTINTKTNIEFASKQTTFSSVGELGPFDIQLVGDFKALRIMFDGARFESKGGPISCDVRYKDFEIQKELKFLSQLQSFFKPKEGSGFYLIPLRDSIGIEAGYGLNIGTISLGQVAFFNVSLNAAARLPFDGKPATFVTSLSRRDAPFTIAVAPYGGSGFFALESNAKRITGFEASFEFGGAGAFKYGPLEGTGRMMTGVYVRRNGDKSYIGATFYAGGNASIWIFHFGASLYVRAVQNDSSMVGDATFTFSFSMGIVDYDYSVNVHKDIKWQKDEKQSGSGNESDYGNLLFERNEALLAARIERRKDRRKGSTTPANAAELRVDTWCQGVDWVRHMDYFDHGIDIDVEKFV